MGGVNMSGASGGTPNARTMILEALQEVGGRDYLVRLAESEPAVFATLVGKVIPKEVVHQASDALAAELEKARARVISVRIVDPLEALQISGSSYADE